MNTLIKEFAFEARLITVDGITRYATDYEFEKRFAELIVKECLVVINQSNGVGDDDVIKISMDVKEHFGVEE